ncbi:MAG: four helix bundle protein [Verrucomicrobiota bacterium]
MSLWDASKFISKTGDCLKEIDETAYWLELLVESGIVRQTTMAELLNETDQLTAIFVAIINKSRLKA